MAGACPKCGWQPVSAAECPRCGVDIEHYRAELRVASALAPAASAAAQVAAPLAPETRAPSRRPAGFWIRFAAVMIDGIAIVIAQAALNFMAWAVFFGASPALIDVVARAFGGVLGVAYPVIFHWLWGQTLGKMAMEIRVVTVDGGTLSLARAFIRQIASWLSAVIFGIGYLMVAFRADKRALHDLIAGTRVERLS